MRGALSKRVRRKLDALLAAWPEQPARFWSQCTRVTGWESLLTCASQHGVLEMLRPALLDARAALPEAARLWIQRTRRIEQWMQTPILETLRDSLRVLAEADVKAVALKGPVLSECIHGDANARRCSDLDFLVAPADLRRATDVFLALGYQQPGGATEGFFRAHHHHLHLQAADRPMVELHFILSSNFGAAISGDAFLERAQPFAGTFGPTWVLSPEDEFLYLAQHAAGHYFARAAWLYDLKMLLAKYPKLDAELVHRRAKELGIERAVRFARHVLLRRLNVPVPQASDPRSSVRHWMGDELLALMEVLPKQGLPIKLVGLAYEGLLADHFRTRLKLMKRRLASVRAATEGNGYADSAAQHPG